MATKYFMAGGVNSNWSTDGNWSTTASSGPANTTKAVNGDAAILDAGSPACIIDTASACTSIVCTGYTNTLTFNATLTAAGTVTFASGMTIAGTSDLICTATATLTSGGKTLTGGLQLQGTSQTFTLSGAWIVTGVLTFNGTTITTLNSSTLSVAGGITLSVSAIGTTAITMTGGTWSGNFQLRNPLTFAGNATVSGTVQYNAGTLTYSSGTITTTGSSLVIGASATLNTNGVTWNDINVSAAVTLTINSLLSVSGVLLLGNAAITFTGSAGFSVAAFHIATLTASRIYTFKATNTYTITSTARTLGGTTAAIKAAFTGSDGTHATKAIMTFNSGVDMSLAYVDPTDIDSSGGIPVYTYKGTIATSTNWTATYATSSGGTKRRPW